MLSVPPVSQPAACPELELDELLLELEELLELELELDELLELELDELLELDEPPVPVLPPQPSMDMTGAATKAELSTFTIRLREVNSELSLSDFFLSVIFV